MGVSGKGGSNGCTEKDRDFYRTIAYKEMTNIDENTSVSDKDPEHFDQPYPEKKNGSLKRKSSTKIIRK